MYYAEKLIDGIWHYKQIPQEPWKAMDSRRLHIKIAELQSQVSKLSSA